MGRKSLRMLRITIVTLFPEYFDSFLNNSIIKRAISKKVIEFKFVNIRDFTKDKHHRVDNPPVGGGAGLIMQMQPVCDALNSVKTNKSHVVLMSPLGKTFNQDKAKELSLKEDIIIVCGHYEGIDYRFNSYCDELISVGDYILTGGEVGALVLSDSITRLLEGAITKESTQEESFNDNLLEYPQYTLPYDYEGKKIPDILFSGNHKAIEIFRKRESLRLTMQLRPDLFAKYTLSSADKRRLKEIENNDISPIEKIALEKGERFIKSNQEKSD